MTKILHLACIAALGVFFSFCSTGDEQQRARTSSGKAVSLQSESSSSSDSVARQLDQDDMTINGKTVTIVCFYGPSDHDDVARKKCEEMYKECAKRYGRANCRKVVNPTDGTLDGHNGNGPVIIVTHSTPNGTGTCDIWDSELTPTDVSQCLSDSPVIWYGCYGALVAKTCPNVIPLADDPEVLDSGDPNISCRFKATMLCMEEFARSNRSFTQEEFRACVVRKMGELIAAGDPFCRGASVPGPAQTPTPTPAPSPTNAPAPAGTSTPLP